MEKARYQSEGGESPRQDFPRTLPKISDQAGLLGSGSYGAIYIAKTSEPEPRDVAVKFCTYDSPEGARNPVTHLLREISVLHYMRQVGRRVAGERAPTVELIDVKLISAADLPAALPANLRNRERCVVLVMTLYDHDFSGLRKAGAFGPLTLSQLVFCWRSLTAALASLHSLGVVHRDIKSSNILLDDMGCCHLADLGMARVDYSATLPRPPVSGLPQHSGVSQSVLGPVPTYLTGAPPGASGNAGNSGPLPRPKPGDPQAELIYKTLHHSITVDILASGPTGTLLYRPPEQLFGLTLPADSGSLPLQDGPPNFLGDSCGDVYSLSLVVLEVLTERLTFTVRAGNKGYNTALMMLAQMEVYGSDLVEMVTGILRASRKEAEDLLISAFLAARARGMIPDAPREEKSKEAKAQETSDRHGMQEEPDMHKEDVWSVARRAAEALPDPTAQRYIKVEDRAALPPVGSSKTSAFAQAHRALVRYPSRLESIDPVEIGGEAIRELLRKPPLPLLDIIRGVFVARLGRSAASPTYSAHLEAFCGLLAAALSCIPRKRPTAAQLAACSLFQTEASSLAAALPEKRTLDRLVPCYVIEEEYSCRGCTQEGGTALSRGISAILEERAAQERRHPAGRYSVNQKPISRIAEQARKEAQEQRRKLPGGELIASCSSPWSSLFRVAEEYGIVCQTPLTAGATAEQLLSPLAERIELALSNASRTWRAGESAAQKKPQTEGASGRQPHLKR